MTTSPKDAAHLKDLNAACYGCGALWVRDTILDVNRKPAADSYTMYHRQPCPYLEAVEYGGEVEIGTFS